MHRVHRPRYRQWRLLGAVFLLSALIGLAYANYRAVLIATENVPHTGNGETSTESSSSSGSDVFPAPKTFAPVLPVPTTEAPPVPDAEHVEHPRWFVADPPDLTLSNITYEAALQLYETYLHVDLHIKKGTLMETATFIDIPGISGHGVALPHDESKPLGSLWRFCDPGNTTFDFHRDTLCAAYLGDVNNMRSIRAQPAYLKNGRTIKFRIFYHQGNLSAIVKVSQNKFFYESTSEYLAYMVDRAVGFSRVPPTVYTALPVPFMKAASAIVSPLFTQWFHQFIATFGFTQQRFVVEHGVDCSLVSLQLWMNDVHSALDSFLAVDYELDDYFLRKYYDPADRHPWPPRPHRLKAIGDICDRFIFDFLLGNTDRGMNDHNNFVYGGCNERTACRSPREEWLRTKGEAKYAFLDHGSSYYRHHEPEGSPFTGNATTNYIICRFRRSTIESLKRFSRRSVGSDAAFPLIDYIEALLPKHFSWNTVHRSVFKMTQERLEKVVDLAERCVKRFGQDKVYVL